MYVYIYIYMQPCVYIYACMHVWCMYVRMYVCIYIYIYIDARRLPHIYIYVCVYYIHIICILYVHIHVHKQCRTSFSVDPKCEPPPAPPKYPANDHTESPKTSETDTFSLMPRKPCTMPSHHSFPSPFSPLLQVLSLTPTSDKRAVPGFNDSRNFKPCQ